LGSALHRLARSARDWPAGTSSRGPFPAGVVDWRSGFFEFGNRADIRDQERLGRWYAGYLQVQGGQASSHAGCLTQTWICVRVLASVASSGHNRAVPDTRTAQAVGPALPRPIGGYQGSVAYWSKAPQRKLVLFVHGFTGSAVDSWLEFPRLLRLDPHFKGYDLVSFAYESNRQPATFSASAFYHFLSRIMDSPASTINAGLPTDLVRATTFGYDRVVIVAHSLGAVVARRALVNAHTQHAPWVGKIALLLFAPAHKGILATHLLEADTYGCVERQGPST
jgi:hypothetical protein